MLYRINSPGVIQETLDGEAVIVNLISGTYYSLDKAGGVIWNLLINGVDDGEVASRLELMFDADSAVLAQAVSGLTGSLVQEGLIVPADALPLSVPADAPASVRIPFEPPVLHRYTDMQELLLLDPIHDVDNRGWPHTNSAASAEQ